MAMLTAVATEQAAGSETSCSSGDGGGDLRRGAAKARSVAELRGKRALGARLARRSGRRQSCRTQWNGARSTVATVTPVRCLRRRRPWWGKGEGEAMGESDDVQGLGARRGRSSSSSAARAASCWRRGELTLAGVSCLPALARASSSLARASTVLGRQVGCQVSFSAFCFSSFFIISVLCFEIVKILFHLEKS